MSNSTHPSAISIFSGAGGLDCGLSAAGFEVRVVVDSDPICIASLKMNGRWESVQRDVSEVDGRQLLLAAGLQQGKLDLLCAGPPCQPFSKSANWRHGRPAGVDDPRANVIDHLLRLIGETQPRVVLIENVEGFRGSGGLAAVLDGLRTINLRIGSGYRAEVAILDAADFGVPQHRRRVFIVADREGRPFQYPQPTYGPKAKAPYLTSWDAIGELSPDSFENLAVGGRWAALLPTIPEGHNYLWHTNRGRGMPLFGWRTRYWSFLLKLARSKPSWTIPAQPSQNAGPFHWDNRQLATVEAARLQTFPKSWSFAGGRIHRIRQIGNAVPPLMGEVLGRQIQAQLFGNSRRVTKLLHLAISRGQLPPEPPPPSDVPPEFFGLLGDHPDHPGPGLGPSARRRTVRQLPLQLQHVESLIPG